jgi:acetyltransferase-like isoleucine patch superfamily enzyme
MTRAGKNVFVGAHRLVLPGANIGDGAVIKGGSVVTLHVPPQTLWGHPRCQPLATVNVALTADQTYATFISVLTHTTRPRPAT